MWRYLVGGAAALLMAGAGMLVFNARASDEGPLPAMPRAAVQSGETTDPLPDAAPEASERTREQKRFDRYDKDRNDAVTREEYLAARRKAFARLDVNHDGTLSFDEWAVKATTKFAAADKDKSSSLTRTEFATTAVKRKPARRDCPPATRQDAPRDEE